MNESWLGKQDDNFLFGLEAEFLLVNASDFTPLWHPDLSFQRLNEALESIPLEGLPSMSGLELEPPHRKLMPYAVEGYAVVDSDFRPVSLLPKGIEIRTPIADSIEGCLSLLGDLHERLQTALSQIGYRAAALSHHPTATHFQGPQNKRRHDYWQWCMEVMTTYGPDVNVGLPKSLSERLDIQELNAKVNYYAPAVVAMNVASPLRDGGLWKIRGKVGKSLRTYRRSVIAPALEIHPNERWRLEFKPFEMTSRLEDFYNYFLLWLELLLDPGLKGRASQQSRVYDLGQVACFGLAAEGMRSRAAEILERAPTVLRKWGFDARPLSVLEQRLETGRTPADEIIELYEQEGSIPAVLRHLSRLIPLPDRLVSSPSPSRFAAGSRS